MTLTPSPRCPTGLHPDPPKRPAPHGAGEPLLLPARWAIHQGDALALLRRMPSESVQCVVTSPPYFGLRDYGVKGQLGLESRPDCLGWATGEPCGECYICHMVAIFREVKRTLRDDGVCFLNIGDTYSQAGHWGGSKGYDNKQSTNAGSIRRTARNAKEIGAKDKDLLLIPFRLALALQADGYYVRSDIIWHKRAPMPESVKDRPTKAHEYILMLTKSTQYFYDQEAVREGVTGGTHSRGTKMRPPKEALAADMGHGHKDWCIKTPDPVSARNLRSVWSLSPDPFPAAHFATFPKSLPERCIQAGTSERGCCPECGKPWVRVVEHGPAQRSGGLGGNAHASSVGPMDRGGHGQWDKGAMPLSRPTTTVGWQPQCDHNATPVPCLVLDPFAGAGTTILVADRLGRRGLGFELNPAYVEMATRRIVDDAPLLMELPA